MLSLLLPAVAAACLAHPPEFDNEIRQRAMPWLPPDLARQIVKHERDFASGAAAAARWPRSFHARGGKRGVEAAIRAQCERLMTAIRSRAPFAEVVAGLGVLAHLTVDLDAPFAAGHAGDDYAQSFARYVPSAAPRIPLVFYGQETRVIRGPAEGLSSFSVGRRFDIDLLESIVREDLDRIGGPFAWRALDDRSSTFGTASLLLNHAATDFVNLASWVWLHAGGLVPEIPSSPDIILVWRGEPQPREATSPRFGLRQARP